MRKDNRIKELAITKQTSQRNFFIVLSLLVLMLVFIAFNRIRLKKKANNVLTEKNKMITHQKEQLHDALEKLQSFNKRLIEQKEAAHMQNEALQKSEKELHQHKLHLDEICEGQNP